MKKLYFIFIMFFLSIAVSACSIPYKTSITVEKVEKIIATELKVGDEKEVIFAFFERHKFFSKAKYFIGRKENGDRLYREDRLPSFDQYSDTYSQIILGVSNYIVYDTDIRVTIYVDKQKRYLRAEVKAVHTGL